MRVISLGWGRQSFTLAAMVALGELEPVDAAIFADTLHERKETYDFIAHWTPWLEEKGMRVIRIDTGEQRLGEGGIVDIPAFTYSRYEFGQLRRQCTQDWKIAPIRRWLQANRNKREPIEQWIGISLDEALRMKTSDVKYITNRWPLIERRMTRHDCEQWLEKNGLEVPPRSSCVFCPFHNSATWRELKMAGDDDWKKAVQVDEQIRKARPPYDLYVHPARVPLTKVDLRNETDRGQMSLWDEECSGLCGV